jgi:NlpC/P60 family/Bacterial dipeptidyl-peptidase Sh3 domain
MTVLDPRINPFRPETAAKYLEGKVGAARFVEGERREIVRATAAMRGAPTHEARLVTQALMGERIIVYETTDEGWAWGQLESDGYVGWISANAIAGSGPAPTHKVAALRTLGFPEADIKLPPSASLPMGALLTIARETERFAVTLSGLHIPSMHLALLKEKRSDFVAVAELFLGTPYLWGGKTSLGIDCSGLVQVSLQAAGIACPRDSDMQEQALGRPSTLAELRRGDLVFWKGHVAIARNTGSLLHANAHHMAVAIESIAEVVSRIKAAGSEVTSVKRL